MGVVQKLGLLAELHFRPAINERVKRTADAERLWATVVSMAVVNRNSVGPAVWLGGTNACSDVEEG